jgi:hypothetical protein
LKPPGRLGTASNTAKAEAAALPGAPGTSAVISWPGFGILFFWQLGEHPHVSGMSDTKLCRALFLSIMTLLWYWHIERGVNSCIHQRLPGHMQVM